MVNLETNLTSRGAVVVRVTGSFGDGPPPDEVEATLLSLVRAAPTIVDLTDADDLDEPGWRDVLRGLRAAASRPWPVLVHADLDGRRHLREVSPDLLIVPDAQTALYGHHPEAMDPRLSAMV